MCWCLESRGRVYVDVWVFTRLRGGAYFVSSAHPRALSKREVRTFAVFEGLPYIWGFSALAVLPIYTHRLSPTHDVFLTSSRLT